MTSEEVIVQVTKHICDCVVWTAGFITVCNFLGVAVKAISARKQEKVTRYFNG